MLNFMNWPKRIGVTNKFIGPLVVTFLGTSLVFFIGDMNSIAKYTTQLFLLSYAMVNVSCMMLIWASAPNFRWATCALLKI